MEPLKIPLKDQEQPWTLCEWPRGSSCWFPPFLPLAGEPSWGRAARTGKPEDPCEREWSWIKVVQWQKGWIKELWIAVNSNTTACTSAPVAVLPNISDHSIVAATFSLSHNVIITSQWSLEAMIFPQSWKFHKVILSPPRIKPQPECPLLIRPAKPQFLISSSPHQILIYEDISLYIKSPQPGLVQSHCENTPLSVVLKSHLTKSLEKKICLTAGKYILRSRVL